jgi:hypothetical protein
MEALKFAKMIISEKGKDLLVKFHLQKKKTLVDNIERCCFIKKIKMLHKVQ